MSYYWQIIFSCTIVGGILMILNKKQFILGFAFGILGKSFYNSLKVNKEIFKDIRSSKSNQIINTNNLSRKSVNDDDIIDSFRELKKQATLLEIRLDELKK